MFDSYRLIAKVHPKKTVRKYIGKMNKTDKANIPRTATALCFVELLIEKAKPRPAINSAIPNMTE